MATERWIAGSGVGLTWTNAITATNLNALANGNALASDVVIANATPLDVFADLSLGFTSMTPLAPAYMGIYLYPLNKDGTSYGDSRFGTAAAGPPPSNYYVGAIGLGAVSVAAAQTGMLSRIVLPPGSFKFVFYNQSGASLPGSGGSTFQYRTYNRQIG